MKLTDNDEAWLRWVRDRPRWMPDPSYEYVRQRCRKAGWAVFDKHAGVWMLTAFGHAALNAAGLSALKEQEKGE